MSSIHPHWEATEPAPKRKAASAPQAPARKVVTRKTVSSRRPAAITGVLLALGLIVAVSQSLWTLPAQLGNTITTVRLTQNGFLPASITVAAGETIRWENELSIAFTITAPMVTTSSGSFPLTLEPNIPAIVRLTDDMAGGTYRYVTTQNEQTFVGQIIIPTPISSTSSTMSSASAFIDSSENVIPVIQGGTAQTNTMQEMATFIIERNPHTVGSQNASTGFIAQVGPKPITTITEPLHSGAPRPVSQPASGLPTWILAGMIALSAVLVARSARKTV